MKYKKELIDEFYKTIGDTEAFQPIKQLIGRTLDGIYVEGKVPKEAMGISDKTMEAYYTQAYQQFKAGHYDEAMKIFRMLAVLNPMVMKYIMGIASCYHMKKDYLRATAMYHLCGSADPTDPIPYYYLSDCYAKLEAREASVECLRLVIKYAGKNPQYREIVDRSKSLIKESAVQMRR